MELSPSSEPAGPWADPPEDIAIAIALSLRKEADVCTLGGSSRAWRIACDSDAVWECFFRRRWPAAAAEWAPRVQVCNWSSIFIPCSAAIVSIAWRTSYESTESTGLLSSLASLSSCAIGGSDDAATTSVSFSSKPCACDVRSSPTRHPPVDSLGSYAQLQEAEFLVHPLVPALQAKK
ncbi:hypothetical protein PR202_ga04468 [Eleusine coracana subsp. coracana]|uniref:F-box domain-containing protein n=1 Tax=Eleusine coracana subsp. coracana TaxID=191504 RepID=A0AAV5BPZ8_ELECO|nr:hypothetical protein PR202_ga04468 [Eleusine coracana subsp. coracana]